MCSGTDFLNKINFLVDSVREGKIKKLSYPRLTKFLVDIGVLEWREWENGKMKRFPTLLGEEIGLQLKIWEKNGRSSPVIYYSESAQRFIVDNIISVLSSGAKNAIIYDDENEED